MKRCERSRSLPEGQPADEETCHRHGDENTASQRSPLCTGPGHGIG